MKAQRTKSAKEACFFAALMLLLTTSFAANAEEKGAVTAVNGKKVTIQFAEGAVPRVGVTIRIGSSVPGLGFVPVDGAWQVKRVEDDTVRAEPVGTVGVPSPGMLVQVASDVTQASTSEAPRKAAPKGPANKATRALRAAIVKKDTDKVKELLAEGADADYDEGGGHTMLMAACRWGKTEIVRLLLKAGADPDVAVSDGMDYSSKGKTAMMYAAASGQTESVEHLLDAGAKVDAKSVVNATALHFAAKAGDAGAVKALIDAGAKVNATTKDGRSPLHEAAEAGSAEVAKILLDKGAKVDQKMSGRKAGYTPLRGAAHYGHLDVVEILLDAGADPNIHTTGEFEPFWGGYTPLHAAVNEKHPTVVKALLLAGADATIRNGRDETALDMAKRMKNDKMVEIIRATMPVPGELIK